MLTQTRCGNMYEKLKMATTRAIELAAENTRKRYEEYIKKSQLGEINKGHHDIKSKIDESNGKIIKTVISKMNTGFTIYDEERGGDISKKTLLVDPIDGTNNLLSKKPYFSISIGAVDNGELVHGIICAPITRETYIATKGKPPMLMYKNLGNQLKLSGPAPDSTLFYLDYHTTAAEFVDYYLKLHRLFYDHGKITAFNFSSALDLCRIADGTIDGGVFIGNMPWDFAAGACILQQAGGKIFDLDGSKFNPYTRGIIAVQNENVMQKLKDMGVLEITSQIPKNLLKFP